MRGLTPATARYLTRVHVPADRDNYPGRDRTRRPATTQGRPRRLSGLLPVVLAASVVVVLFAVLVVTTSRSGSDRRPGDHSDDVAAAQR